MKCVKCPLFTSWNNESDRGECCGMFGDAWDSPLQYEDKNGDVVGCYIDSNHIKKLDREYAVHLGREADGWQEVIREHETIVNQGADMRKEENDDDNL